MSQISKPYEESVTASDHKIFLRVRLKLTAVYLLIISCILLGYNTLNYLDLKHDISEAKYYTKMDTEFKNVPGHAGTLNELVRVIILEDLIILSFAAWVSYLFAGRTLRPVQKSIILQRKFAENASHELRTPLAVMKTDIEVLLRDPDLQKEDVYAALTSVTEEIDRMTLMTQDLLLIARSEASLDKVSNRISIIKIIEDCIKKITPLAERAGVIINFDRTKNVPYITGETIALERVFLNLLQNSITHTSVGGVITISVTQNNSFVVVTIKDNGKGITVKDLPHIFERFYKGGFSTGTGLGLSIVKEIVTSYGGEITVKSEEGVGTLVTLQFPQKG